MVGGRLAMVMVALARTYLAVAGCILVRMHRRGVRWSQLAAPVVGGSAEE
jgi:hypothetical protein